MKILADDKIPYLRGALEPFAEVVYLPGSGITPDTVHDADALIIRTRTVCDQKLLDGSAVKFIASATIGTDHLDTDYCRQQGIAWRNAPGCNAGAVCQYVAAALFAWARKENITLRGLTIGIIGVGHVGRKVAALCETLGMHVLLNDPPRQQAEGDRNFVDMALVREQADILSFHVPLNVSGAFATRHMADERLLNGLGKTPLLLNTCRGEVFDTVAVMRALEAGMLSGVVLDCWENEPEINLGLLQKAVIGTPHIAGYSNEGKANGTMMSVRALSRFFHLGIDDWFPNASDLQVTTVIELDGRDKDAEDVLGEAVLASYDILTDDRQLRLAPESFERLREQYPLRREFHNVSVEARQIKATALSALKEVGFRVSRIE